MNRHNIWIHVSIAVVFIALAAVLGQISRWKTALFVPEATTSSRWLSGDAALPVSRSSPPEVLVRFKSGVSFDRIRSIASAQKDSV